jgi:hypothetical protein
MGSSVANSSVTRRLPCYQTVSRHSVRCKVRSTANEIRLFIIAGFLEFIACYSERNTAFRKFELLSALGEKIGRHVMILVL